MKPLKIQIEETVYEGTATEIMGRLRDQTFDPTEFPDIESYIWFLQSILGNYLVVLNSWRISVGSSIFAECAWITTTAANTIVSNT